MGGGGATLLTFGLAALGSNAGCDVSLESEGEQAEEELGTAEQALNHPDIQPGGGMLGEWTNPPWPNAAGATPTFLSYRDNPTVNVSIDLRPTQEAQKDSNSTYTERYRLTLLPLPISDLTPLAMRDFPSGRATHEVHGLQLTHTSQQAVTLERDDWDLPKVQVGTSHFKLHPDVKIVKVRVIELYANPATVSPSFPCSGPTAHCGAPGWIGEQRTRALFDDRWEIDNDVSTTPAEHPAQVISTRTVASSCPSPLGCIAPPEKQPDAVWAPCKIQFQLSEFHSCMVPQTTFLNTQNTSPNACSVGYILNDVDQAVRTCAGVAKAGELTVIYLGAFTNPGHDCIEQGVIYGKQSGDFSSSANPPRVYLATYGHADDYTLAHEIGHALLGGGHPSTEGNLMHGNMSLNGPTLTTQQCATAYSVLGG